MKQFSHYLTVFFSIIFFVFSISSCIPPDVKGTADTQFFDLKGFLDNQITSLEKLEEKGITITKKTILQGQKTEQTLKKIDWKDEFAFFYSSDINTPQLRDRYKMEKSLQKWIFKTDEENLIVKEMQITFNDNHNEEGEISFKNVKEILIIQKDKNNIYENDRILTIKAKEGILESYSIKGSEDVILNEKQEFLVEGIIK
ncbi:hypothetical protein V9L05_23110 (plasmid) [Bernardetia sp. Wsw4-3y2]|uniref:hypothetical protein n=1 Tax=Bernardetia sp. Wsw4-3y2 TaxID=3127471 RepID=UPI0030D19A63